MKKLVIVSTIMATLVAVLISASSVFAQSSTPATPNDTTGGYGRGGRMAGAAGLGQSGAAAVDDGLLQDGMIEVYANALGMSVDALNARLEAGETLAQIAFAQGLSVEDFNALMVNARSQALEQAVANGTLTQAQADWSQSRGNRGATRGAGMTGAGYGLMIDCPYSTQPPQ